MKKFIKLLVPSILGSGLTIAAFLIFGLNHNSTPVLSLRSDPVQVHHTGFNVKENGASVPLDFTGVSKEVMNSVVHIKSVKTTRVENSYGRSPLDEMFGDDFFRFFYGEPQSREQQRSQPQTYQQVGTGSGVIISSNGYIITNNHVVDQADDIEVTLLDNEVYKAKVIGTDPSTDLALLQIKKDHLPALTFANSDDVEVGEWVIAVGNPFNLNSTVTAGIVSAKGRNINIIDDKSAIEAFIQTDAAINPGNSGGALVDLNGDLIGINTAIASPTGTYAGYGFAIPSNIATKVIEDFMKYGTVQRAYLGIMIRDVNADLAKEDNLKVNEGAYVDSLVENSAAGQAGIREGDVIVKVGDNSILKTADLLEQIGMHRPGDQVQVTVNRNGKEMDYMVTLANQKGSKKLIAKDNQDILDKLGANFETLSKDKAKELGIDGGVVVEDLSSGLLKSETEIQDGFIITGVNKDKITSVDDLRKALNHQKGGVMLEGIYENYPGELFYAFGLPE